MHLKEKMSSIFRPCSDISCVASPYSSVLRISAFHSSIFVRVLIFMLLSNLPRNVRHAFFAFFILFWAFGRPLSVMFIVFLVQFRLRVFVCYLVAMSGISLIFFSLFPSDNFNFPPLYVYFPAGGFSLVVVKL